jgi:hypothetical protein
MNEQLRHASLPATTQAAEGLPRRRWSVAEIEEMVAKGILLEDERFELIGGEVVPMSPKGARHELVKKALQQHWFPFIVDPGCVLGGTRAHVVPTPPDVYLLITFAFHNSHGRITACCPRISNTCLHTPSAADHRGPAHV